MAGSSTASWPRAASRPAAARAIASARSEEHTSELQSQSNLVCRLLLEKKKKTQHSSEDAADAQVDLALIHLPWFRLEPTLSDVRPSPCSPEQSRLNVDDALLYEI